jgi:hypothetical protein
MRLVCSGEFAVEIGEVCEGEFARVGPVAYAEEAKVAFDYVVICVVSALYACLLLSVTA